MSERHQHCTFYVDGQLFGIEVERVQEIIRHQAITRIPLAPGPVAGLINLRGQIVPAVELGRCLGLAPPSPDRIPTNVVVRTDDGAVSLLVDEIGDVLEVDDDDFEAPPEPIRGERRQLLRGVYKLEHGLLMAVSIEAVVAIATRRTPVSPRSNSPTEDYAHGSH